MSDEQLRALEHEILAAPAELELRRRHAQLLLRAGAEDRGIAALDLAWRLGAEDLWDELQERLEKKARRVCGIALRYVPAGPFVMGSDDLDFDARPAHLVTLSAFYMSREPLTSRPLEYMNQNWPLVPRDAKYEHHRQKALDEPVRNLDHTKAVDAIAYIESVYGPDPGGKWSLPTEAQWERVFRATHFRRDGACPYGVITDTKVPEWTADAYDCDAYGGGPRRDPSAAESDKKLHVVRGIPVLPPPHFAIYREAALPNARFELEPLGSYPQVADPYDGVGVRLVFVPR
jgi:formylglycine-generating enzyme required for sulfatase activity